MTFRPYVLYLSTTYSCNFHCKNCYAVAENPKDLSGKTVENIIEGASEKDFIQVWLSGGEATLFPDKINHFSELISNKEMMPGLVTNAWFGAEDNALKKIKNNIEHFEAAQISLDAFHEEAFKEAYPEKDYVECIGKASKMFLEEGIITKFRVIDSPATKKRNTELSDSLFEEQIKCRFDLMRSSCLPYGRGKDIEEKHFNARRFSEILGEKGKKVCKNVSLGVAPIGVYFCCTPPGAAEDYILLKPSEFGKYEEKIISESLKRANKSEKVNLILKKGIKALYKKFKSDKDPYGINNCSVCQYSIHKLGGIR